MAEDKLPDYPKVAVETNIGNFTIELFAKRTPKTARNFVNYVESGYYDGVIFHRVIAGFMVQAGGYDLNYKKKESQATIANESGNGLSNRRGFIAMARTTDPHSANSQFYINLGDNLALDPSLTRWGYTVFGRVIEGMDVVDQIGYVATGPGPIPELSKDVPIEPVVITHMAMINPDSGTEINQSETAP
ncbi:MAG: peptidyl-prolyl cis-trans isomerase [Gammaproteobacteria bacterium]|nr:peptidyl-prolyl cis-trans isomerase [Gammaproteobacteria bacterium]MCP4088887.1 peptidyl-prolyl cis-trans isomerase [Gammaproteobacteria bacterium]MCP4274903.1 peptidyl-prolyl cis-trans isomerase [Gammaproteobacteria bacterium]MCP4832030.1 peptidyl-prolyl cis-trans isomerase [Gammaproteobacteria bacterium]MCP4929465.1 peptidyl-prolyl cis-trans isomerase [Gammaproteobacteria bacterium]